jgi:hypothetical protein
VLIFFFFALVPSFVLSIHDHRSRVPVQQPLSRSPYLMTCPLNPQRSQTPLSSPRPPIHHRPSLPQSSKISPCPQPPTHQRLCLLKNSKPPPSCNPIPQLENHVTNSAEDKRRGLQHRQLSHLLDHCQLHETQARPLRQLTTSVRSWLISSTLSCFHLHALTCMM